MPTTEPADNCPFTTRCHDPRTREEAYAAQFHDDARLLYTMARVSPEHFQKQLRIMEIHIQNYREMPPFSDRFPLKDKLNEMEV